MEKLQIISSSLVRHRTSREMFPLVSLWLESDLKQVDFCKSHKLTVSTFAYWLKKYRDQESVSSDSGRFISVSLSQGIARGGELELIFPNGVKIQVGSELGVRFIRDLVGPC